MPDRQRDVRVPHFSLPFRFGGINGGAFLNEQDLNDDITDCLKAIIAYPQGSHDMLDKFGIPDILFRQSIDNIVVPLQQALRRWEPRTPTLAAERPDIIDTLVRKIIVGVREV
jgi:phage baseplate assembly protein W